MTRAAAGLAVLGLAAAAAAAGKPPGAAGGPHVQGHEPPPAVRELHLEDAPLPPLAFPLPAAAGPRHGGGAGAAWAVAVHEFALNRLTVPLGLARPGR